MDEAIGRGAMSLIDYGVLGIFCLIFIGTIVYLNRENGKRTESLLAAKDTQIKDLQGTIKDHVANQDRNISELSANVTRLIDLYGFLRDSLTDIPDKIANKLK